MNKKIQKLYRTYGLVILMLIPLILSATESFGPKIDVGRYSTDLNFAQVVFVKVAQQSEGTWCISTTVRHNDEGWSHYADAWQVIDEEGNVLGKRLLAHPHDDEQPFTRSQCGIKIPVESTKIVIRAKCQVHGFGGRSVLVDLSLDNGDKFKVTRI